MIKYINILKQAFVQLPWFYNLCILLFIILFFIILASFLFLVFKKYSLLIIKLTLLDYLIPYLACISPTIIIILLKLDNTNFITKLEYIIFIHLFFVMPFMYKWSKNRRYWPDDNTEDDIKIVSWTHPLLSYYVMLTLTYIYIWIFYFSFIRFRRLGTETEILLLIKKLYSIEFIGNLLFLLMVWPVTFTIILIVFSYFITLRNLLWNGFSTLIYSLHSYLLCYTKYISVVEPLYKFWFIIFNIVCLNAPLNINKPYKSFSILRRIIHHIYYKPYYLYIIPVTIILGEIIIFHKITFSYFILFWMPILIAICHILYNLGLTFLIVDVSMQDYSRGDLNKIHYKPVFWQYAEDPETFYGFSIMIPDKEYILWEKEFRCYYEKNKIYSDDLIDKLFEKINALQEKQKYNPYIYFLRIKIAYYKTYKIRWNHKKCEN